MDMQRTGRFLASLRKEHGLTQEQLAERLGTSNKTISRWETGAYMPPVEMLLALSETYRTSINELLAGERIAPEEACARAEETLTVLLRERDAFDLQEKRAYWSRKWLRDHRLTLLLAALGLAAVTFAGALLSSTPLLIGGACLTLAAVLYLSNARQAYIEHHLYDD